MLRHSMFQVSIFIARLKVQIFVKLAELIVKIRTYRYFFLSPIFPKRLSETSCDILESFLFLRIGEDTLSFVELDYLAMSPCVSLHVATAPYYREARVTFAWRQTAS